MKYKLVSTFLEKTLPFLALLILWETGSRLNLLNNSFFSSPVGIFGVLFESNFWKIFFADFLSTLTRLILGFFFGYGFANLLIFAGFYNRFLLNFFKQINSVIRYLPIPVVIPLAILAFGLTDSSKILVISFSVFIVYFAYLVQVLNKEEKNYKVLQISLNTTPFSRFKDFFFPIANYLSFRVASAVILWGLGISIIVELILGGETGLGVRLLQFQQLYQTNYLFAYIFLIIILSVALETLLVYSFSRFKWDYLRILATSILSVLLITSILIQGQNFLSKNIFSQNQKKIVTYSAVVNLPIFVYFEKFNTLNLELSKTGSGVQAMDTLLGGKAAISGYVDMPNALSGISSKTNFKIVSQVVETPTWPSLYLVSSKNLEIDDFSLLNESKVAYYPNNPIIQKGLDLSLFIKKVRTPSVEYLSSNDPNTLTQALVSNKTQALLTIEPFVADSEDKLNIKRLNPKQTLIAGLNFEKLPLAGVIIDTKQFSTQELNTFSKGLADSLDYIQKNTTPERKATSELQEILKKNGLNPNSSLSFWENSPAANPADLEVLVKLMQTYNIDSLNSLNSNSIKELYLK